ncbi:MAG: Spy/CpxP family protein refolding chaperone [Proteobacteria bacterium]|nr:Spy/CpxP family protein refolding chaperone [Pseudomonadota bacterium]
MTDHTERVKNPRSTRSALVFGGGALAGLLIGLVIAVAGSAAAGPFGLGLMAHRGGEAMKDHMLHRVDRALDHLNATDEQRTQIEARLEASLDAFAERREGRHEHREQWVALLTGDEIDRDALDELRRTHVAELEEASQEILDVVADVAEVLTAEQRKELAEWMSERRHRRHGRHHRF